MVKPCFGANEDVCHGSCVEMKLPSSAVLFLILWKFILMIFRGLWACLSAIVVGGEASLLLVGYVLMSSEENELLVLGELGRLLVGLGMLHDIQCQEMLWRDS